MAQNFKWPCARDGEDWKGMITNRHQQYWTEMVRDMSMKSMTAFGYTEMLIEEMDCMNRKKI